MANPNVQPLGVPAEDYGDPSVSAIWNKSPLLFPNDGQPEAIGGGQIALHSDSTLLSEHSRGAASVAAALGGTPTTGDVLSIVLKNAAFPSPGAITVTYTVVAGDTTLEILADHLVAAINASPYCQAYGISAATNGAGALTFYQMGPVGNFTVVSFARSGTGDETMTFAAGGAMSGGSGPIIPRRNFAVAYKGQTLTFRTQNPQIVDGALLSVLVNGGAPVA